MKSRIAFATPLPDPPHLNIGRRGNLLPSGKTTIDGIALTMLKDDVFDPDMFGGALHRNLGRYCCLVTGGRYRVLQRWPVGCDKCGRVRPLSCPTA
jgi:hypothetical protein